jgi:hypothetical protein
MPKHNPNLNQGPGVNYNGIGTPIMRLIEEPAELQKALCKADRFGWFNHHPSTPERTNMDDVKAEMDDVVNAIERMAEHMRELSYRQFK